VVCRAEHGVVGAGRNACMMYVGVRRGWICSGNVYIHVVYPLPFEVLSYAAVERKRLHHREEAAEMDNRSTYHRRVVGWRD
jgi:hypothetical protein